MRLRVAVFGTLGALATLVAGLAVFAPDLAASLGPIRSLVEGTGGNPRNFLLLASGIGALFLAWLGRGSSTDSRGTGPDPFDALADRPPEAVTAARGRQTAWALDGQIGAAVRGDDTALTGVRERLRTTATTAYATTTGVDRGTADAAVRRGDWTDDPVAAAFLAGEAGPPFPVLARLRLWLDPGSERERRVRRTVRATQALRGGRR